MKLSAILSPLIAAKAEHDTIMRVVMAFEAEQADALERRRESDRKRQAAKAERDKSSRDSREPYDAVSSRVGVTRVEDKTSTQKIEPQKTNTHAKDLGEFRSALTGVCDEQRVDEFVKLRRKKRGAVTGHAAKLFMADAEACGLSVPAAIDTCISRNWITVKPEFLAPRQRAGPAPPQQKPMSLAGAFGLMAQAERDRRDQDRLRTDEPAVLYLPGSAARARG